VDLTVTDRRIDARFAVPGMAATLRPGCAVVLVNLSAGGALVEGVRPIRPGAKVHLRLVLQARVVAVAAHVLRCAVWSLHSFDGVLYRGALRFDERTDVFREGETPVGCSIPAQSNVDAAGAGKPIPVADHRDSIRHGEVVK
jgi:hypothetical protein